MDIRILLGANVARLRKEKNLKQEEFCVIAGITQSYLSQIENGHVNLTLLGVHDLAQAFEVSPDALFKAPANSD